MSEPAANLPVVERASTRAIPVEDLGGRRRAERLITLALFTATAIAALPALAIVTMLIVRGAPAISYEFLFSMPIKGMTAGGILPAIAGTLWLVGVSLLFAVPV